MLAFEENQVSKCFYTSAKKISEFSKQLKKKNIYLSIIVKVWIKADTMTTCCLQIHKRRRIGIILREVYIKFKTSIGIRGVCWASY